jgi:hypothetical protein
MGTVVKRTVSLERDVADRVAVAAKSAGIGFSTWLSAAAERQLRLADGLAGVAEWEAEHGGLTDAERAQGDRELAAALGIAPTR